mgnify:FL=1
MSRQQAYLIRTRSPVGLGVLAKVSKVPLTRIQSVIACRSHLRPAEARRLAFHLGIPAAFLLGRPVDGQRPDERDESGPAHITYDTTNEYRRAA